MSTALVKAREQADALRGRLRSVRDKMKSESANVMRTAVGIGTGYALGYADSRWGENAVAGMDNALAVGIAATAAAYFDVGGAEVNSSLRAVGDSGLAVYGYKTGFAHQEERGARE